MLIQFRVVNHRSLRDEQVLSMVAAERLGDDAGLISTKAIKEKLLPAVAIYGANASGKSNVLDAMRFAHSVVAESHRLWSPTAPIARPRFALSGRGQVPSEYEFDVVRGDVRYRYGFSLDDERIRGEWLYAWPKGRRQTWFERDGDEYSFGKHLKGENEATRLLTRPNSLFLSTAVQNNHPTLTGLFVDLLLFVTFPDRPHHGEYDGVRFFGGRKVAEDERLNLLEGMRRGVLPWLKEADVGVRDIELRPTGRDGALQIWLQHSGGVDDQGWLTVEQQSFGTQTLLFLFDELKAALTRGVVVVIDELEASLHPSIALRLVRLFNDPKTNPGGGQLIFTTHDTNLLGRELSDEPPLRRDQVWFTEKDPEGATHLYPLTDFHPRKAENLERGYLQGRYGAVPYLGELGVAAAGPDDV